MASELSTVLTIDSKTAKAPNLANLFTADDLVSIGHLVFDGYQVDIASRAKWAKRNEAAMNLAMQAQKGKSFPWPGCANIIFPLVTIGALQFSARSYSNLIQGADIVRYRVPVDDPTGELNDRANRISQHMSWQVLEQDCGWEEEHDRLLINLAIVGTAFVKTYFCPVRGHNVSELVLARDLVLNYWSRSVEDAPRKTHIQLQSRNEIFTKIQSGIYCDVRDAEWFNSTPVYTEDPEPDESDRRKGLSPPPPSSDDADRPFRILEQHRLLDLDKDGYYEPYIVTIEESSQCVLRIVARWDVDSDVQRKGKEIASIAATEYFTKYSFIPSPDGGIYDVGLGILLGPINEAVNSAINQLLDTGTLLNTAGGFLGRGAKVRGGQLQFAPHEWKRVDSTGDDLRKNIVPLERSQPSTVTYQLLQLLIGYAERIASTTDTMVGVSPGQNTPAETTRHMLEQGSQFYNVIFKRVWRSLKEEFKKLHRLNALFLSSKVRFGSGGKTVGQEDYKGSGDLIIPSADPNMTSLAMRVQKAQAMRQAAYSAPGGGYDFDEVERRYLQALQIEGIDKIYVGMKKAPPSPNPKVAVEQMRLQDKERARQQTKQITAADLRIKAASAKAQIDALEAQAAKDIAGIAGEQSALQLQRFESVVNAIAQYHQMAAQRQEAMNDESNSGGTGGASDASQGDVSGMAATSDDGTNDDASAAGAAGSSDAMGEGDTDGDGQ